MKIHIFYRHYNIEKSDEKSRPPGFDYEKCFENLLKSLQDKEGNLLENIKLYVVFDGYIGNNFISKYRKYYTLHEFYGGSDYTSFFETVKYAKTQNIGEKDLVYFLENDYLHVYSWVDKVVNLFSTFEGLSYVSLYDHNDKYFLPMYEDLVSKIITTQTHHWRTTPSTCGSFIISKQTLEEDFDILSTIVGDHNKFLWLNQNRGRSVITPIPGLSTHCMEGLMSPTINWEKINNK